jgi:alkylmercury lyase
MKPLLPAVDAAGMLREAAFALLLRERRPVLVSDLAGVTGLAAATARASVASLAQTGWLDLDDSGRVTGAAGLSLLTGPHELTMGDAAYRTWCAYDALGISAALVADTHIETTCGQCQAPIRIPFRRGIRERHGPERLWLAEGGADLRGSFCTPTVLLRGGDHGLAWAESQGGRGRLLDLAEGASQGGLDWAGCAAAARRLS